MGTATPRTDPNAPGRLSKGQSPRSATEEPSQAFKNSRVVATVSGAYWKIAPWDASG
jgi:hypothetical protein